MTRKNRVDPFGRLIATPARGTLMGNRGCLHDSSGQITKQWARKQWVICLLQYKGRHRQIMAPGQYTELFFLDEATALSVGHRPCGTCQKARYDVFKQLWLNANGRLLNSGQSSIQAIDDYLHNERNQSSGERADSISKFADLPDGTFVVRQSDSSTACLCWGGKLFAWEPGGYIQQETTSGGESVQVLTPQSVIRTLREGFWPQVHPSVADGSRKKIIPEITPRVPIARDESHSGSAPRDQFSATGRLKQQSSGMRLYRLKKTPAGKELFTYFAAILRVTGMDKGVICPLNQFLGNFSTHTKAGRIDKVKGGYRLTSAGIDYFADRYRQGNRQHVEESDVQGIIRLMQSGGSGWESVDSK